MGTCPHCNRQTFPDPQGCNMLLLAGAGAGVLSILLANPCPALVFFVVLWFWWNSGTCTNPRCPGPTRDPSREADLPPRWAHPAPSTQERPRARRFIEGEAAERRANARYEEARWDYEDYRELASEMGFGEDHAYGDSSEEPAYHRGRYEEREADFEPFESEADAAPPPAVPVPVSRRPGGTCRTTSRMCEDPSDADNDDGFLNFEDDELDNLWREDTDEVDKRR